jgi:hypothetical protein
VQVVRKIIALAFFIIVSICSQANAESFDIFIEMFFKDASFQKQRVTFPFYKTDCSISTENNTTTCKDTLICNNASKWVHLKYANGREYAKHKLFTDEKRKNKKITSKSDFIVMEVSAEDTDFDLIYIFKRINNSWFLIKEKQWEID